MHVMLVTFMYCREVVSSWEASSAMTVAKTSNLARLNASTTLRCAISCLTSTPVSRLVALKARKVRYVDRNFVCVIVEHRELCWTGQTSWLQSFLTAEAVFTSHMPIIITFAYICFNVKILQDNYKLTAMEPAWWCVTPNWPPRCTQLDVHVISILQNQCWP